MATAPKAPSIPRPAPAAGGRAPRKLQVPASVPPPEAKASGLEAPIVARPPRSENVPVDVDADTAHAVPADFDRALQSMMAKRAPTAPASVPAPPIHQVIPPPPPSTPPERMPSRAAIVVGSSFNRVSRSSFDPVVMSITTPSPMMAAPVPPPPSSRPSPPPPPPAVSVAPPRSPSRPAAYEQAFARWSQPDFGDVVPQPVDSTAPLTFQVYTPDALPPPSRRLSIASEQAFVPPPAAGGKNLLVRAAAVILGIGLMVGVGFAGLAAASDDGPRTPVTAAAPPPAATTTLPTLPSLDTAAPAPIPAPTVVVAPDPAPAPAKAAAPAPTVKKPAKKKAPAADKASLPPNPYGG